jgi:hypothetical protein
MRASITGLAPYTKQSGRLKPRNALYMASLSAIRYNPIISGFICRASSWNVPLGTLLFFYRAVQPILLYMTAVFYTKSEGQALSVILV